MTIERSAAPARLALKGDLLDFAAAPQWARVDDPAVRFFPDHWLLIEHGRIAGLQAADPGEGWQREDHSGRLILPGFVDTHVHSPQLDVIASYGTELLDWLNTYTFPAEGRYIDPEVARFGADRFLDALLAHGTTSAVVYPTVHKVSADALFDAAAERGMRLITGKVLMDRHAPEGLRDAIRLSTLDTVVSLSLAFLVNAAILTLAASAFHAHGQQQVTELQDAYHLLEPIVGTALAGLLLGSLQDSEALPTQGNLPKAGEIEIYLGETGLYYRPKAEVREEVPELVGVASGGGAALAEAPEAAPHPAEGKLLYSF